MTFFERYIMDSEKRTCFAYPRRSLAYKQSCMDLQLKLALKQSQKLAQRLDILEDNGVMLNDEIMKEAIDTINRNTTSEILYVHSVNVGAVLSAGTKRFDRIAHPVVRKNKFIKNLGIDLPVWYKDDWTALIALLHGPFTNTPSAADHWSVFCYFKDEGNIYHYDSVRGYNLPVFLALFEMMDRYRLLSTDVSCREPRFYPQQFSYWECGYRCIQCIWTILKKYKVEREIARSGNFAVCCRPLKRKDVLSRYVYAFEEDHETFANLFHNMLKI